MAAGIFGASICRLLLIQSSTGSSRRRLIPALKNVATIDLFVHDSAHTASNVLFEMSHAGKFCGRGARSSLTTLMLTGASRDFEKVRRSLGHGYASQRQSGLITAELTTKENLASS